MLWIKAFQWLLTIFLVGSHFFLTGKLDSYLYDYWPNERLEYNLAISMYLSSALSAAVIGVAIYIVWALKMPKINLSKKKEEQEEEDTISLPEGPLFGEKEVRKFAKYVAKTTIQNYANVKKELDNAVDSEKQYELIVERYFSERGPSAEWK